MSSRLPFRGSGSVVYPHTPDEQKISELEAVLDAEIDALIDGLPRQYQKRLAAELRLLEWI